MPFAQIQYEDIYFDLEVQEMCVTPSFKCPFYGHSWSCPPNSPYLEKALSTYSEFYLIYSIFDLESYIKKEKEKSGRSEFFIRNNYYLTKTFESDSLQQEFKEFLAQYNNIFRKRLLLYAGTCNYCNIQKAGFCTFDSGEPCRFPRNMRYSMEAVGIEVIRTVMNLKKQLSLEYPSKKYAYTFGLACFK